MACSVALFVVIIILVMCFLVGGLTVMAFRMCKKQQRKKCPRLVVTFRHQPGSSSVLNSSFHPSTSGPPYRATTLPLRTTKYNVPLRLCPTSGPQFDGFSTRTLFAEKVSSHLGILKHGRKTESKSFDMSWV
ncbi:uncharacterized protein LOC119583949 [Penaeus monodon]|uniref:uncharacterized protein LOC119583949 n=1 Tax=Penaeus monodon TaxID=6687 RepID=UPI0018A77882|nr:uncharacterized protein LOC119583949 [Penaeus monodon]